MGINLLLVIIFLFTLSISIRPSLPLQAPQPPFSPSPQPPSHYIHNLPCRPHHSPPPPPALLPPPPPQPSTYDHFRISLTWPFAFCLSRRCGFRPSNDFSLHGVWPEYQDGNEVVSGRGYCVTQNRRPPLIDEQELVNIDLQNYWYSLLDIDNKNEVFWNHEWRKHGYCAFDKSMIEYFKFAKKLRIKLGDITEKFREENVYPSHMGYQLNVIEAAIRSSIGARNNENILVKCSWTSRTLANLDSFEYCVDKSGTIISCPVKSKPNTSCVGRQVVIIPNSLFSSL